jgi:glycosyltransferase involved in cell wall biosynthesis
MVIPSRQDNLPNTAVEAHACGTPVVAFNTGGLPDIVEHQCTGYLAKAFETEDLAQGVAWVLAQRDSVQLGQQARERAVARFSEGVVAAQYRVVYEMLREWIVRNSLRAV